MLAPADAAVMAKLVHVVVRQHMWPHQRCSGRTVRSSMRLRASVEMASSCLADRFRLNCDLHGRVAADRLRKELTVIKALATSALGGLYT